ncbi:DUF3025 domain-containing protein [Pseudoalteromonas phenolica]|uniref:DUF3025 domain-containing protein n=1 Tax=Pseudoalteromonas phenolica TaxID=161398 RepID=A0A0S2K217_9GAMM|nr:DUF3025 domain-containing protein [Pseudoalteromonas phenolica]ALO42018.1 hypothetical protein PP2015_1514 [Pseudoalteromonas phenolica]MBE0353419.1 hypothetical protein [Pseudoalteromonas phenolica O-BC30]RXF01846.1 DUF3025 domain-containing protein [Pseudoalteromonas phenolica O-BC30]
MKRFVASETFSQSCLNNGAFGHLNTLFNLNSHTDWPSFDWLNGLKDLKNPQGLNIRFTPNSELENETRYYEAIIFETGQVPTREQNWHDLFGAFIWCLFPKTKALLNELHIEEIEAHGTKQRSKKRNAITLFDECGVILVVNNDEIISQLKSHQWSEAFVEQRAQWSKNYLPFTFGHANYEMMTNPFIGLTGKLVCIKAAESFYQLSLEQQYHYLDAQLYQMIKDGLLEDNKKMSPLPLLGVPSWYEENKEASFYANTDYFRPKRK